MEEMKPNERLKKIAESLRDETWKQTQSLASGAIKMDHKDVRELLQAAAIIVALEEIRDELRFANQAERMKAFPQSLFNLNKQPGESP